VGSLENRGLSPLKHDIYRVGGVLLISLLIGLVMGRIFTCLFLGLLIYVYWQHQKLRALLDWMRRRRDSEAPYVPGVLDAITNQYEQLRNRHKKSKIKLSTYLQRFKQATQSLPDAVVVLGENDEIEWANSKARDYLGIRNPQDKNQRIVNLIRHPNLARFMKEIDHNDHKFEKSLELISPVNKDMHLELRLVFFGGAGKLLVARDITKIYRINRMRTDFIANASHELRTPLTVISGYLESFEDDYNEIEAPATTARIRQMRKQAERMKRLIEDLLKLSSLETTEHINQREPVRLPDLLNGIIDEARVISGEIKHEFRIQVDPDLWIEGDRNQIYSAIANVVNNAVQHTADKGIITLRWFLGDTGPVFEVIDTGEGISAEHIPRVTERFYRVDSGRSREKGGTGLGLAIVKHILARHNARLEVESEPGKGSTFRFCFPTSLVLRKDVIDDRKRKKQTVLP